MKRVNDFISAQLRRPTGAFGRLVMTRLLDRGNRGLIDATLDRLDLQADVAYLDIGFGGGRSLRVAAKSVTRAPIYGTDFSPDVIQQGQRRFAKLIAAGRVHIIQADITDMPLRSEMFGRISTMNTIYFWPEPERAAAELHRLLAPGGRLAIGYTGAEKMAKFAHISHGFTPYMPADVEPLLTTAGFVDVATEALHEGLTEGDFVTTARSR